MKNPSWVPQKIISHRLSESEPLGLNNTMHWDTAPKHIQIFLHLSNIDGGTPSSRRKILPILTHVSTRDRRPHDGISSNSNSFIPDWLRIHQSRSFLSSLQLLNGEIKGSRRNFFLTSPRSMTGGFTLRWAEILHNHNTLLRVDWH